MKRYFLPSVKMTIVMLVLCCVFYFGFVALVGSIVPGGGGGEKIMVNGRVVGYDRIGQKFTDDRYFWGRPSTVDYNASGSAGSNKGPSNPQYLRIVEERIDSFIAHNSGVSRDQIPAEMVTASGSGLDPHISPAAAHLQVPRVAKTRKIEEARIKNLVEEYTELNPVGPDVVNVLKLNVALDALD